MIEKTIVALSTPPLISALAVIRLSGQDSIKIVDQIFSKDLSKCFSHTVSYGYLKYNNEFLDEVMITIYKAPQTYTKEDMVEITCHGSMLIVNKIIAILIALGASQAVQGEFTKRAYLNGRIDLVQAEAVNDVIHGQTNEAIEVALSGVMGGISSLILELKNQFSEIIGQLEVNIDYPEYYDIEVITHKTIQPVILELLNKVEKIIQNNRIGMIIKDGISTAIIGKPNVGKSSLLNALLGEDKAIVSEIPGTTRDVVEGRINISGITLNLLDTAGIHYSKDKIENIGISKAKEVLKKADLVLLVIDNSSKLEKYDQELLELTKNMKRLIILNKNDLPGVNNLEGVKISAINNQIDELKQRIKEVIGIELTNYKNTPLLTNTRHLGLMMQVKENLLSIIKLINENAPVELLAVDLKLAFNALQNLLGNQMQLDYDEQIFSKFCVGK